MPFRRVVATTVELDDPLEDLAFHDLLILISSSTASSALKVKKIYSQALGLRGSASQAEEAWSVRCSVFTGVLWSYYPFVNS